MRPRSFCFLWLSQQGVPAFRPLDGVAEPRAERASPARKSESTRVFLVPRIDVAAHFSIARSNWQAFAREHAGVSRTFGDAPSRSDARHWSGSCPTIPTAMLR